MLKHAMRDHRNDAGRAFNDDVTFFDDIEAYCGSLSCAPGDAIAVHMSTRAASFDVTVERWGATRDVVWSAQGLTGEWHDVPSDADSNGCRWPVSFEVPVGADWRSGFYLVTLTAHDATPGRGTCHAGFVVRAAAPTTNALLVLGTNTWNAYNTWGGASLYTGGHQVSFRRPWPRGLLDRPEVERDDRKARPVRFGEEPDAEGEIFQAYRLSNGYSPAIGSTGWFTHERRFVEWAERAGWQFDMACSSDLDEPGATDGYQLIMGVGHDEYWTSAARDVVDAHIARGGQYLSLSGNTMFWQVRLSENADHMICWKYAAHEHDPVVAEGRTEEMTGLWCDPLVGRPEWTTIGAGSVFGLYHRFGQATPRGTGGYSVFRPDHWLFEGTGLRYGDLLGGDHGVVGYETVGCPIILDELQLPVVRLTPGMPADLAANIEIVGLALSSNLGVGDYPTSISALSDQGDLEFMAERFYGDDPLGRAKVRHGNSVMLTARPFADGGEVVTIGTTDWVFGLADDRLVAHVTDNALRHLGCERHTLG